MPDEPDKPKGDDAPADLPEAKVVKEADVPPTRKHAAATPAEPPPDLDRVNAAGIGPTGMSPDSRDSAIPLPGVHAFPDDGPLSARARHADHVLGLVEQGLLFALLGAVVIVAASATLSDKLFHYSIGRWWFTVVRDGTFAIAMFGAVIATQQQRHLAMDLVSRQLPPRGRLVLGVVLKLFVIGVMVLLFRSGLAQRDTVGDAGDQFISDKTIVTTIPIAAALIVVHSILHLLIDADYLVRNKLPPERMRSGH